MRRPGAGPGEIRGRPSLARRFARASWAWPLLAALGVAACSSAAISSWSPSGSLESVPEEPSADDADASSGDDAETGTW